MAEVWPERGGPAGRGGEHDQCDVGEEHEPQDVVVLDVAGGERGGTLAVEEAGQGEGEGDEEAEHVQLQDARVTLLRLQQRGQQLQPVALDHLRLTEVRADNSAESDEGRQAVIVSR